MTQFPQALKTWRKSRRFSQLDLALEADVSSRHISFLETGRAQPSRDMVHRLSAALELPLATQNQLLINAGFAGHFAERDWDNEQMAPVRAALEHTLSSHAPYPAFAVDKLWNIVKLNDPGKFLFGALGILEGTSLLDMITSDLMPNMIENWPEVAQHAAQRLRTESTSQGGVKALEDVATQLAKVGGKVEVPQTPVIPTIYNLNGMRLSLFSTIAQFGTPTDVTLDDLKIELFFPADEQTELILKSLARNGA